MTMADHWHALGALVAWWRNGGAVVTMLARWRAGDAMARPDQ